MSPFARLITFQRISEGEGGHMSTHPGRTADEWGEVIAEAYAARARSERVESSGVLARTGM
ncbi:protein of unknown function [Methylorubrum extorquens DM4]|uniref:Uncharacterized protein n=1 Tax=Methylorubrum extorquens (strain DSM 6343 / CIP 106787 / DM4) TaxID=661410 RepID=C7CCH2_METED|nr:protein of unknown function [Methylorubrum extorquens DM4]